eukprot:scaffold208241_cov79-Cyclotella_meneghiniana.AAC.1
MLDSCLSPPLACQRHTNRQKTTTMMPPFAPTAAPQQQISLIVRCRSLADIMTDRECEFRGRHMMD